jgi:hypothetical protein
VQSLGVSPPVSSRTSQRSWRSWALLIHMSDNNINLGHRQKSSDK